MKQREQPRLRNHGEPDCARTPPAPCPRGVALLGATLDSLQAQITLLDEEGDVILTNSAWKAFGAENGGRPISGVENYLAVCDAAEGEPIAAGIATALRSMLEGKLEHFSTEYPCHAPEHQRWFQLSADRYRGPGEARIVIVHDEITERHLAELEVQAQSTLLDEVDVAVVATDLGGRTTHWNRGAEKLFGWTRAEALGRRALDLLVRVDEASLIDMKQELHRSGRWEGQFDANRRDGSFFPAFTQTRVITADGETPAAIVGVSVDITDRVAAEHALLEAHSHLKAVTNSMDEGLATLDAEGRLTYMNEAAEELLGYSEAELRGKVIHDLTHSTRPDGTALSLEQCPISQAWSAGETVRIADDLFIRKDGSRLEVSYTASPFHTDDGVEGCAVVFRDISGQKQREQALRRDAETLMRIDSITGALAEDRMVLLSQPITDAHTGEVVQNELLLRMREPDGRLASPGTFLPVAEEYGLIGEIDRWVIAQGAEIASRGIPVEVNVSGYSIGDHLMLDHIRACLRRTGADPSLIVFELTETAFVRDAETAGRFANGIHALGCKLALDDFGAGYGSFTYLKQLPIDYLKIDIEFVRDIASNSASRHLVEAVVGIAKAFGLQTIGEGVEDARSLQVLADLGVDFAQGYHLGRPGPLQGNPGAVASGHPRERAASSRLGVST